MLSYQHGYHAGNFADVHKHTALCLCLRDLGASPKLTTFIDCHSGAGLYDLSTEQALKTSEFKDGIQKLETHNLSSQALKDYLSIVQSFGENHYPGSPALFQKLINSNHRGLLFELHPKEFEQLSGVFADDKRFRLMNVDSHTHLSHYLPKRTAPGLVLFDPSYEIKEDYANMATLAKQTHKRWPSASLLVWYPILTEKRHEVFKSTLKDAFFYELIAPDKTQGMLGTGLAVLNPPAGFEKAFKEAEAELQSVLFP